MYPLAYLRWKRSHSFVLLNILVDSVLPLVSLLRAVGRWLMSSQNRFFRPRISLAFILTACLPLYAAVSNESTFTIDDASGTGQFYTSPAASSSIPSNSTNSTIPQWTHEDCSSCLDKPDLTAVNGGTYTAIYLPPGNAFQYNISFGFNGGYHPLLVFMSIQITG
jgi:hypothetical protein